MVSVWNELSFISARKVYRQLSVAGEAEGSMIESAPLILNFRASELLFERVMNSLKEAPYSLTNLQLSPVIVVEW